MSNHTDNTIELAFTVRIDTAAVEKIGRILGSNLVVQTTPPEPPKSTRLLTVVEAAQYLGVSKRALYGMRYSGDGPPVFKIGNRLRYRVDALEEWLLVQTSTSTLDL